MTDSKSSTQDILSEFKGCVYRNVQGYYGKFFPGTPAAESSFQQRMHWEQPSMTPISEVLGHLQTIWINLPGGHISNEFIIDPSASEHDMTVLHFRSTQASTINGPSTNATTVFFGIVETGPPGVPSLQRMAKLFMTATKVFNACPDRLFLQGFHIYNDRLEPWTFDRAGCYSGAALNIVAEPDQLRHVLASYRAMSYEGCGLNPLHKSDGGGEYLELASTVGASVQEFHAEAVPIFKPDRLLGTGTSCFQARSGSLDRNVVVKFYWSSEPIDIEVEMLGNFRKRGIRGVPELHAFTEVTDIAKLREGLTFDKPEEVSSEDAESPENSPQLWQLDGHKFENRYLRCIVISPLGRPFNSFKNTSELLETLRDIVKTLRVLYLEANILHRDIAPKNIIINNDVNYLASDSPLGLLIDFDFALDLGNIPEVRSLIGSEGFMAIGILGPDDHSYRHDLESLFYVFLWTAICFDGVDSYPPPPTSRLNEWLGMDWDRVLAVKVHDMKPENFAHLIETEFLPQFRPLLPLATSLHALLFCPENGKISLDIDFTPDGVNCLYDGMIVAFEQYI